jgi:hypothetical protein
VRAVLQGGGRGPGQRLPAAVRASLRRCRQGATCTPCLAPAALLPTTPRTPHPRAPLSPCPARAPQARLRRPAPLPRQRSRADTVRLSCSLARPPHRPLRTAGPPAACWPSCCSGARCSGVCACWLARAGNLGLWHMLWPDICCALRPPLGCSHAAEPAAARDHARGAKRAVMLRCPSPPQVPQRPGPAGRHLRALRHALRGGLARPDQPALLRRVRQAAGQGPGRGRPPRRARPPGCGGMLGSSRPPARRSTSPAGLSGGICRAPPLHRAARRPPCPRARRRSQARRRTCWTC